MKLIHVAFGLVAASLLPTASADEPALKSSKGGASYTISFASDVSPVAQTAVRYPAYAGERGQGGACDVTFVINPAGEPDAIRVGACTSEKFRRTAKKAVQSMTFAAGAPRTDVQMRIRWTMNEAPALRTASLD